MRRGYLLNVTVLLLVIPLLLLAATYQQTSGYIISSHSQRTLIERQYFSIVNLQDDLENLIELSFKRAYLTLTDYVIRNNFVDNASLELKNLVVYGTLNGVPQSDMENLTIEYWFTSMSRYLSSIGFQIQPSDPDDFIANHLSVTVGPLDSFHVVIRVKIWNITITDSSGTVVYSGNIPPDENDYVYSVVSVVGFEDPFIVRELNGLYTRVITPCRIPFPSDTYGYYLMADQDDVDQLVLNWCYLGIPDNSSAGMYYPSILERFEGTMRQHDYYTVLAKQFQEELGFSQSLPIGLETFLVPDSSVDPTLVGALVSIGANIPENYTSVSYYFLRCTVDGQDQYCVPGDPIAPYLMFKLDPATRVSVFGQ